MGGGGIEKNSQDSLCKLRSVAIKFYRIIK